MFVPFLSSPPLPTTIIYTPEIVDSLQHFLFRDSFYNIYKHVSTNHTKVLVDFHGASFTWIIHGHTLDRIWVPLFRSSSHAFK